MRAVFVSVLVLLGACSRVATEDVDVDDADHLDASPRLDARSRPDAVAFPDAVALAAMSVDYADPNHGPFGGGTKITLRGRGFASGMAVTIGGRRVLPDQLEVLDSHRATVVTPAGNPGPADIAAALESDSTVHPAGFHYDAIVLDPVTGATAGGTFVTVRGLSTNFTEGDQVLFDGRPMTGVQIVNGQQLTGYVPRGEPGTATVEVRGAGAPIVVPDGFTYQSTTDAYSGGFGGGPLDGTLNVTIIDNYSQNGIANAFVVIGDPKIAVYKGFTDPFGEITFSGPGLSGQITLTAGHPKYESGAFVGFDARDATMFLSPLPVPPEELPPPGPPPPARPPSTASGDVFFGGSTAQGTDMNWGLVPEPSAPGEVKRIYVFATARDIFNSSADPGPGGTIDFSSGPAGWHYTIPVRTSAFALVAVAGLYNPEIDPDGPGPAAKGLFVPYALGVLRNLVAGPGDVIRDIPIPIDIPLDTALIVKLAGAPPLSARGPDEYRLAALIDLGGEGVIRLPGGRATFRDQPSVILTGLAPLSGRLADASYTFVIGAYSSNQLVPYTARVVRGVRQLGAPIVVGEFLGVPRAVDPPSGGTSAQHHLVVATEGGTTPPTFYYHRVQNEDGWPVFRIFARGDRLEVPLYDLTGGGLPPLTTGTLTWNVLGIVVPNRSFDTFNYGQLNSNSWNAYTSNTFDAAFP